MSRLRIIGLALVAVFAFSAVSAVSASASSVCYEEIAKCPAGKLVPASKKIVGHNIGNSVLTASSGVKITCTGSTFEDEITENIGGKGKPKDKVTKLEFTGCTESVLGTGCKVKNVPEPPTWLTLITWLKNGALGPNGSVEVKSVESKVECATLGVTCVYKGVGTEKTITGELFNAGDTNKPGTSTLSEAHFNESELVSVTGGSICGTANAKENALYGITDNSSPVKNVFISEE